MAFAIRTIDEIFQQQLAEKQALTSLNGLVDGGITNEDTLIPALSDGSAPEWVLWLYNNAVAAHLTDVATESGITDIEELFAKSKVPTNTWYIEKSKEFQYGDTVIIDPVTYQVSYATVDESKKIIGSVTLLEGANNITLKVRRTATNLLSTDELNAFVGYIQKVKAAGTRVVVHNYDGDLLTLNITILYDPAVPLATLSGNVEGVINTYLNNLPFDSRFITNELVDKLQDVIGVKDARFYESQAINALGDTVDFDFEYTTNAGWAQINPATPLTSTITYIAR